MMSKVTSYTLLRGAVQRDALACALASVGQWCMCFLRFCIPAILWNQKYKKRLYEQIEDSKLKSDALYNVL